MLEYNYIESLTLPELNALVGGGDWEVLQIEKGSEGGDISKIFLVKGTAGSQNLNETMIVEGVNGNDFYFEKTINAGDVILITLLFIILVFGISKFLLDFIIPKRINFKR